MTEGSDAHFRLECTQEGTRRNIEFEKLSSDGIPSKELHSQMTNKVNITTMQGTAKSDVACLVTETRGLINY